jgi:hypothetical protein
MIMNDIEFQQRAFADPWDQSPEFLQALRQNAEYAALVASLQAQDKLLKETLSAPVPVDLKSGLLAIPSRDQQEATAHQEAGTSTVIAPSIWQWQRWVPAAACLLIISGVLLNFLPGTAQKALASDVMTHIYRELPFLDVQGSPDRNELNRHLATYGGEFDDSVEMNALEAKGVIDCWIEKDQQTHFHMVMQGELGMVTVIIMTGEPVSSAFALNDERFDGIVTPTPNGNLVVAGEKGEPVEALSVMLAGNISW